LSNEEFLKGQEKRRYKIKNIIICIHLSAWMVASQGYLGIVDPGRQSSARLTTNQAIAGKKWRILKLF
jgi:hypothetical protein